MYILLDVHFLNTLVFLFSVNTFQVFHLILFSLVHQKFQVLSDVLYIEKRSSCSFTIDD